MLSHILYGTATLNYGGLLITATAAGKRGEAASLQVTLSDTAAMVTTPAGQVQYDGVTILVSVINPGVAAVFAPTTTAESGLVTALNQSPTFKQYATVIQDSGDGTAQITTLLATNFTATGGLRQQLETRLGILGWNDRDLVSTGAAVGLLWPAHARIIRETVDPGDVDHWIGTFQAAIAFQHNSDLETQNALLDIFRRGLYLATKEFVHPDLEDIGPVRFIYGNVSKDESAGTVAKDARLRVVGAFPIHWTEPAYDPSDLTDQFPLTQFQAGLFNNPILEDPGAADAILDTQLIVTPD